MQRNNDQEYEEQEIDSKKSHEHNQAANYELHGTDHKVKDSKFVDANASMVDVAAQA